MLSIEWGPLAASKRLIGHGHAAPHLLVVSGGSLMQDDQGVLRDLSAGSFRLSPPGARHDLFFGSTGAGCLVIEAEGAFWRRVFSRAVPRDRGSQFGFTEDAALLSGMSTTSSLTREHITALGRILAAAGALRPSESPPPWMEEALELIEHGPHAAIEQVARVLGRDRIHFTRAFGDWMGFRPVEYRAMRRAAAALDMVRTTGAGLAEIALDCGYAHQSHMNRAFQAILGRSPSQWRD